MRKSAIVVLSVVALFASQLAVADEGVAGEESVAHHAVYYPQPQPYVSQPSILPAPKPKMNPQIMQLLMVYLLVQILPDLLGKKTTTAAPTDKPTTKDGATTENPTTEDPCPKFKKSGSCTYYVASGAMTWNEAKDMCSGMCSSKLAYKDIDDKAEIDKIIEDLGTAFPAADVWVGLTDEDGSEAAKKPKWLGGDEATATFVADDYDTAAGTVSCGFYRAGAGNVYRFGACSKAPAPAIKYALCQKC